MNGFVSFLGDPKVHDTALLTMLITAALAPLRKFKTVDNTPIAPGFWSKCKLTWNYFVDFMTGFWSMKQGQPLHPLEVSSSSSEIAPDGTKTSKQSTLTTESPENPTAPAALAATK
jgi:hypothetical protein